MTRQVHSLGSRGGGYDPFYVYYAKNGEYRQRPLHFDFGKTVDRFGLPVAETSQYPLWECPLPHLLGYLTPFICCEKTPLQRPLAACEGKMAAIFIIFRLLSFRICP